MNNNKIKYKKVKATAAENHLKAKYDATRQLLDGMNAKNKSAEEYEKQLAKERREARLKALQEMKRQKQLEEGDDG